MNSNNPADLAREAIDRTLAGEPPASLPWDLPLTGLFLVARDAEGRILSSLGTSRAEEPSGVLLARLARALVDGDPRFPPLTPRELEGASIRLWVLDAPRAVGGPEDLRPGEALRVVRGRFSGVFLPENYVGEGWDPLSYLKQACRRAGLEATAFQREDTAVHAFSTALFTS